MSFAIGIPTYNRADLLNPSLLIYSKEMKCDIHVVNNGRQRLMQCPSVNYVQNATNIGVGASWNQLCDLIFKDHSHALILNDDIYLGHSTVHIQQLIDGNPNKLIRATPDWCAFIMPRNLFQEVGRFDECFMPAYYEDKSYEYRLKLHGHRVMTTPALNPFVYRSSQTIELEPTIMDEAKKNRSLYIQMWGGEPRNETHLTPFNK